MSGPSRAVLVPPHNLEAEEAVLGAMLLSPRALVEVAEILQPEDFYRAEHRHIFCAIRTVGRADPVLVLDELRRIGKVEEVGGAPFLHTLYASVPTSSSATHYAAIVAERAVSRRLIDAATTARQLIEDGRDLEDARQVLRRAMEVPPGDEAGRLVLAAEWATVAPDEAGVWGRGDQIAWAVGEPVIIAGPDGVGKTAMLQNLLAARAGARGDFLGMPVALAAGKVLYLAIDRPAQAQRSMARMVPRFDMPKLGGLLVWKGPPPFNIAKDPSALAAWANRLGADTVGIDSLKDLVPKLSDDDVGSALAIAFQHCMAAKIDVVALHHPRKAQGDNKKPASLADLYGSRWITAVAGSVFMLWGDAGDPVLELRHIKQPRAEIGPLRVYYDHDTGDMRIDRDGDPLAILRAAKRGLTVKEAARAFYGVAKPRRADEMKARRLLEKWTEKKLAVRREGSKSSGAIKQPDHFYPVVHDEHGREHATILESSEHEASTASTSDDKSPGNTEHADDTHRARAITSTNTPPSLEGVRVPRVPRDESVERIRT